MQESLTSRFANGNIIIVDTTLKRMCTIEICIIVLSVIFSIHEVKGRKYETTTNMTVPIILNSACITAVRLELVFVPIEEISEVTQVPIF